MVRVEPRPGGARPRPRTDAFLRRFARFVLGFVFREVEIVGAERLPASGPVIVVANHTNSLVDGALLLAYLPRIPRFLAASTVWDYKPVAPFMNASGSVKVFRKQDGRAQEGSLEDSFAEAAALLAEGGVLAIFPEGRTHDTPALLPFKTGTARIARFTQDRHGGLDLPVVPLGVDYEVKNLFRTRACFTFGAPVRPGADDGADGGANDGAVTGAGGGAGGGPGADGRGAAQPPDHPIRAATGQLQRALSAVAPDFVDVDEARAMTLAAEILALDPRAQSGRPPAYSRIVKCRHAVEAAFLRAETVARAHETRAALDAYAKALDGALDGGLAGVQDGVMGAALEGAGLADHEVAQPPGPAALVRSGLALLAGLPVLLIALVLCLPQALLLRRVSRTKPRDRQMTWATFGGLVVYPLSWFVWAIVLGLAVGIAWSAAWGGVAGAAVFGVAPVSARLALPTYDRGRRLTRALRARRRLRRDPELGQRLAGLRAEAKAALDALLADRTD